MKKQTKTFQLILTLPDSDPILYRLEGNRIRLGRDSGNQIQLAMKSISSSHCEFILDADASRCELVDLGSTNGTRVNGSSVREGKFALRHGDVITLGGSVTAQFIQAIEAAVAKSQATEQKKEKTGPVRPINPVAAAVAQQEAKLQSNESGKKKEPKRTGTFGLF